MVGGFSSVRKQRMERERGIKSSLVLPPPDHAAHRYVEQDAKSVSDVSQLSNKRLYDGAVRDRRQHRGCDGLGIVRIAKKMNLEKLIGGVLSLPDKVHGSCCLYSARCGVICSEDGGLFHESNVVVAYNDQTRKRQTERETNHGKQQITASGFWFLSQRPLLEGPCS